MAKPRPVELHVNSKGRKELKFQEVIHSTNKYLFYPVNGKRKTDLFNSGFFDGRKKELQLVQSLEDIDSTFADRGSQLWVLAIPKKKIAKDLTNGICFSGRISLNNTYLVSVTEVNSFVQTYCVNCEGFGELNCYKAGFVDCGEAERDKYLDGAWKETRKEQARERKQRKNMAKGHKVSVA